MGSNPASPTISSTATLGGPHRVGRVPSMCGRFVSTTSAEDLARHFEARFDGPALGARFNVSPGSLVWTVVAEGQHQPERLLGTKRWGLVPSWAKEASVGNRMINARLETVGERPAYRRAFHSRRCLVPADGFFEWEATAGGPKQPWFFSATDGHPLAFAGLHERWVAPADPQMTPLETVTIITTDATEPVRTVHDRMPLALSAETWDRWLDPELAGNEILRAVLDANRVPQLEAWPVDRAVGNPRNEGAELITPVKPPETGATLL